MFSTNMKIEKIFWLYTLLEFPAFALAQTEQPCVVK